MRNTLVQPKWLLAVGAALGMLVIWSPAHSAAQEAEPAMEAPEAPPAEDAPAMEEEPPAEEGAMEEPVEEAPLEEPAEEPEAKPAAETPFEPRPIEEQDPAVAAVLESKPETPYDLLRAIRILIDLKQPKLAAPLIEKFKALQLDDTAKATLVAKFDSAALIRLARDPGLKDTLGPIIDDLFKGSSAYRRSPERLAEWAAQLASPDENNRALAVQALMRAREASVAPLVAILADPKRAAQHPAARWMLVSLGDVAIEPLLGVLDAPDPALKTKVVEILGALGARQASAQLLGPLVSPTSTPQLRAAAASALARISGHTPDTAEAMRLLENGAWRSLGQSRNESGDGPATVPVWHWSMKRNESMPVLYDQTGAALVNALRLARDLYQLDPNRPSYRLLYLTTLLQAAKFRAGLDKPLPIAPGSAYMIASSKGVPAVEDVLVEGMKNGYYPAATAAAQILGDVGSLELLSEGGAEPSPLARAADSTDRRLRFAATEAVMKLQPTRPFAGSSHVTESLGLFISSYGTPRILIAHPLSAEGAKLAGLAKTMGYDADVATNGRDAFRLATSSPDYELIFVHSAIQRPAVDDLVMQLRRDRRTSALPIGLIATLDNMNLVRDFARRIGRAEAILEPQKEAEMKLLVGEVLARAGRAIVPASERQAEAVQAIDWLVKLAEKPQHVFDLSLLEPAILPLVYRENMSGRAVELLGQISGDKGQRALVELAGQAGQNVQLRRAAVVALARSVRQHGLLLTTDEIRQQYDMYNANAGRNLDTHEVQGAVLDVIEHKGEPAATP